MGQLTWKHWIAVASATLLLSACGQSGDGQNAQEPTAAATQVTAPEKPAAPAASEAKPETAAQQVQTEAAPGAMGAKAVPDQPAAPANKGAEIYAQCVGCHGPTGGGGVGPRLAGQPAEKLIENLQAYKAGKTVGPQTAMMAPIAQAMSDEDIEAVAHYIAENFK